MPNEGITRINEQALIAFFQDLHRHPELGGQEKRTTRRIASALSLAGVEIIDPGLGTGLIAVIRGDKPGRVIGLRADIDALPIQEDTGLPYASQEPGKMHACGHDFHTAAMLGAALLLKERQKDLCGAVKIVFQPAEEVSEGGRQMVETGLLGDCEEFYAGHVYPGFPAGTLGIRPGPVMAAPDAFTLRIYGQGAHAGNPHLGVDPIPAAAAFIQAVQTLMSRVKDAFEPAVLSVTHVQAGSTWNVVPEDALIEGTLRTLNQQLRQRIQARAARMADLVAQAHGCRADMEWVIGPDPVINDEKLCLEAEKIARDLGLTVARQDNTMGGEDFSEYLKICPGVFVRVGTGGGYTNHHPRFTADPAALWPAANFFAELALRRACAE